MTRRSRRRAYRLPPAPFFLIVGAAIGAPVMLLCLWTFGWPWPAAYLVAVNLATVFLYGYDKLVAGRRALRVPERILHLFALIGGTPGAFFARWLFRHKTVAIRFRLVFWMIFAAQAALLALWWRWSG
jgi:uncharacterized membrane protein YsdA (DUF1294 family)